MRVPVLKKARSEKIRINTFGGYSRKDTSRENVFYDMKNMTGKRYPKLSSREPRGILNVGDEKIYDINSIDIYCDGQIRKNALIVETEKRLKAYYEDNGALKSRDIFNIGNVLRKDKKTCVVSGSKIYYFPDNISYDLLDGDITVLGYSTEYKLGSAEGLFYEITLEPCDIDGNDSEEASAFRRIKRPCYSLDASGQKGDFYGYMKFSTGIEDGDSVKITGFSDASLNGYYNVKGIVHNNETLIIESTSTYTQSEGSIYLKREIPKMDYVIACNNRLWGCRYGTDNDGQFVNEIYASALGDGRNWYKFLGISTDSWAASVGSAGAFTGAVCMNSSPVFFKEDAIIKVYGDYPSEFCFTENKQRGIESGSADSAVFVHDDLYYKTFSGIVRYDGGVPVNIDGDLGDEKYKNAIAGTVDDRYFISMENEEGKRELFVYDTVLKAWHKEDDISIRKFCRCGGELYFLCNSTDEGESILFSSKAGKYTDEESEVEWSFETVSQGYTVEGYKYVSSVQLRLDCDSDMVSEIYLQYDNDGVWHRQRALRGRVGTLNIPIRPRRCDSFRIRMCGKGGVCILSLIKTLEECSPYGKREI